MQTPLPLPINPTLLTWARNESGYAIDRVARSLSVKPKRIEEWESGERPPTLKQVQSLAHFYHRPLNVFFLPSPPNLTPLASDYRRLPGVSPGNETPELRLALRQMINRRESAINLMEELGEPLPKFGLTARLSEPAEIVGVQLRVALGITDETQLAWQDEWQAWREFRSSVEQLGVLVFQFPKVELSEVRGLALLRFPLPVVGVNSKEQPESRNYTLLHEVVHLMLASGKEELPALLEHRSGEEWKTVERFVEQATSHALISESILQRVVPQGTNSWDIASVRRLARKFQVTPLAMATRLRSSGYMNWPAYNAWKKAWNEYIETLPKKTGGFANPVGTSLGRNGRPFAKLVLEALENNRITAVDASRHLSLKYQHFEKLRDELKRAPTGAFADE